MPAPITQPTLGQLNALGGGFPPRQDFELGTYLNSLAAAVGSGGAGVVFAPGHPNPPAGTYTTWATAFAAAQAIVGVPVWLEVDDTYGPCSVPAGTYDFRLNIWLHAPLLGSPSRVLELADGVVFQNLQYVQGSVLLRSLSTSPIVEVVNGTNIFAMTFNAGVEAQGTAPFFRPGLNGFQVVAVQGGSELRAGAQPAIELGDPTATALLPVSQSGVVQDSAIAGAAGTLAFLVQSTSAQFGFNQPGFLGAQVTLFGTQAALLGYAPAVPGDWVGPAPVDAQQGLDRLAAAVAGLLGGPIP